MATFGPIPPARDLSVRSRVPFASRFVRSSIGGALPPSSSCSLRADDRSRYAPIVTRARRTQGLRAEVKARFHVTVGTS